MINKCHNNQRSYCYLNNCDDCPYYKEATPEKVRVFSSGATRNPDGDKYDFEGFLSPIVLQRFAKYMQKHRLQSDGKLRPSDNWQRGIPRDSYIKSLFRHFMDLWMEHRGWPSRDGIEDALCGIIFNAMGYLFEVLRKK